MASEQTFDSAETARAVLEHHRIVAVVGLSPKPDRPSYGVASYLKSKGYTIIPIHPAADEILGEKAYASLLDVPAALGVEIVDVFRRSAEALPHAEEAVKIGAKALWMQDGVINQEAAELAAEAGLAVVMNRCMARDHSTMFR